MSDSDDSSSLDFGSNNKGKHPRQNSKGNHSFDIDSLFDSDDQGKERSDRGDLDDTNNNNNSLWKT